MPSGLDYGVGPLFTAGSLLPSNNYVDMILSIFDHLPNSDESEPSWLEPELELKDFQLGSACDLFPSARNRKLAENEPKLLFFLIFAHVNN